MAGVPEDLREFLKTYPTTEETLREFEAYKRDLDLDPFFVAEYLKVQFTGDLHQAMEDAGISQSELANRLGESRQYVSKVLKEQANFTIESMAKLACALGLGLTIRLHRLDERMEIVPVSRRGKNGVRLRKRSRIAAKAASAGEEPAAYEAGGKARKGESPRKRTGRAKASSKR